ILLGSLCLVCALRVAWPRKCERTAAWSLACGLASGLAFWMHPLSVWYLLPAALAVLPRVRHLQVYVLGPLGFALGALPVWIFNVQTNGATFRFVFNGASGQTADRLAVLQAWWNNDLPRGAGLWHPWGPSSPILGAAMAIVLVAALAWAVLRRGPLTVVLLFLVTIPTVLVMSGFGGPALNEYGFDATGRYAPPIWFGLVAVLGAALAALWRGERKVDLAPAAPPPCATSAAVVCSPTRPTIPPPPPSSAAALHPP